MYAPASTLERAGGDWYDAFELRDGRIGLSIGDVAGHGPLAAVMVVEIRQAFRALALTSGSPVEIVEHANTLLQARRSGPIATAIFALFEPQSRAFHYATAGHPPPLAVTGEGRVVVFPHDGLPLGVPSESRELFEILLPPGATVVLYTDGLTEFDHDMLGGEASLFDAARAEGLAPSPRPAAAIHRRVLGGRNPSDDVAILTMRLS